MLAGSSQIVSDVFWNCACAYDSTVWLKPAAIVWLVEFLSREIRFAANEVDVHWNRSEADSNELHHVSCRREADNSSCTTLPCFSSSHGDLVFDLGDSRRLPCYALRFFCRSASTPFSDRDRSSRSPFSLLNS